MPNTFERFRETFSQAALKTGFAPFNVQRQSFNVSYDAIGVSCFTPACSGFMSIQVFPEEPIHYSILIVLPPILHTREHIEHLQRAILGPIIDEWRLVAGPPVQLLNQYGEQLFLDKTRRLLNFVVDHNSGGSPQRGFQYKCVAATRLHSTTPRIPNVLARYRGDDQIDSRESVFDIDAGFTCDEVK